MTVSVCALRWETVDMVFNASVKCSDFVYKNPIGQLYLVAHFPPTVKHVHRGTCRFYKWCNLHQCVAYTFLMEDDCGDKNMVKEDIIIAI